jgi:hypothetical protein
MLPGPLAHTQAGQNAHAWRGPEKKQSDNAKEMLTVMGFCWAAQTQAAQHLVS